MYLHFMTNEAVHPNHWATEQIPSCNLSKIIIVLVTGIVIVVFVFKSFNKVLETFLQITVSACT